MKAVREAVGWNVDVAIECHRGMRPAEAIELGRVLRPYRPYFYEDPIPDNLEAMRQVIRSCDIPVSYTHLDCNYNYEKYKWILFYLFVLQMVYTILE